MSRDLAARLRALAERHPVAADAAELRELAKVSERARSAGGRARVAVHAAALQPAKEAALGIAVTARASDPELSQAALAVLISGGMGARVPQPDALRRWVRAWERAGALTPAAGKQLAWVQTKRPGACHTLREQEPTCPAPPKSRPSPSPPSR